MRIDKIKTEEERIQQKVVNADLKDASYKDLLVLLRALAKIRQEEDNHERSYEIDSAKIDIERDRAEADIELGRNRLDLDQEKLSFERIKFNLDHDLNERRFDLEKDRLEFEKCKYFAELEIEKKKVKVEDRKNKRDAWIRIGADVLGVVIKVGAAAGICLVVGGVIYAEETNCKIINSKAFPIVQKMAGDLFKVVI